MIFDGLVLSMLMQVFLDSLFARPGSVPIWGGKKGEFRDRTNSGGICHEIAQNEAGEESSISYKSISRPNKVSFASNGKRDYKCDRVTSFSSMVGYTAVRHSGVSVVLRAFRACVNVGRHFFSPPPGKLGAATVSKSNLDEEPFV